MELPFPIEIKYIATLIFIQQIGKGAFGCVKTAIRAKDQKIIVTKFIKKNKIRSCQPVVLPERSSETKKKTEEKKGTSEDLINTPLAVNTEDFSRLPEEIRILLSLSHPNIIKVLDVHENSHYFQMVMEHHGEMDLFEFVDLRHRFVTKT